MLIVKSLISASSNGVSNLVVWCGTQIMLGISWFLVSIDGARFIYCRFAVNCCRIKNRTILPHITVISRFFLEFNAGKFLSITTCANSLITLCWVSWRFESRITSPNTKVVDMLHFWLSITEALGLGSRGPNLSFFVWVRFRAHNSLWHNVIICRGAQHYDN